MLVGDLWYEADPRDAYDPVMQHETMGFADPTMVLAASADDKEVVRATKAMGAQWVARVRHHALR